jgi:GPH family glycoside/pentoside/hexuronide:cation symporter
MSDVADPPPVDEPRAWPAISARPKQMPFANSLAFASLGIPTAIAALMLNTYMPRFYAGHEGLTLASVAAVFGLTRLIDIPFDPLVGILIDRTRVAFGRYRLWLLCSVPLILAASWGLFMPPPHVGVGYLLFWLLVDNAGYAIMVLSYYSWAASLSPIYAERARLFGFMQSLSVLGAVGVLMLPLFTHGRIAAGASASTGIIGWIVIVTVPLCVGIVAVFTPEQPAARAVRHSMRLSDIPALIARPNVLRLIGGDFCLWLALSLTAPIRVFFLKDAKGLSIAEISLMLIFLLAAGAFGAPMWSRVAARIGKHRTIHVACAAYALFHLTLVCLPRLPPHHGPIQMAPIAAILFAIGFCGIAFPTLIRAMAGDAADEVLLEKGIQRTSLLYSMMSTTTKCATALGVITFPLLAVFHFRPSENAINTPHSVFGLVLIYCISPLVFLLLGALALSRYDLDAKRHGEIREALDRMEA